MELPLVLVLLAAFRHSASEEDSRFKTPDDLEPVPDNLQYAFMIMRHGIRTPLYDLSQEETKNYKKKWPEGRGILTESGREEMLHVGESLRTRYKDVAPDYVKDNVVVTSTIYQRTAVSVELAAKGLFSLQALKKSVTARRTNSFDKTSIYDETIDKTECPTYVKLRDGLRSETKRESWSRELFFKILNVELEHNSIDQVKEVRDVYHVWDTITMEKFNLKPEREWSRPFMSYMFRIAQLNMWRNMHGRTEMIKFYTGPMLYTIINEMEESRKQKDRVKLHLHGSHDSTLSPLMWALSHQDDYLARPGDVLIVELYKDDTVKVALYSCLREAPKKKFWYLSLKPLCKMDPCPLSVFKEKLAELSFSEEQWKIKCTEEVTGTNRRNPKFGLLLRTKPFRLWVRSFFMQKKVKESGDPKK